MKMQYKEFQMKKRTYVQILYLLSLIVLLSAGSVIINVPDKNLIIFANYLGFSMLYAGITNLFVYYKQHKRIHGSHWILADGLSTTCLSFFPLFNQMILPSVIPFFFGIWELFSGILKFIESTELQEEHIKGWEQFLIIGTFELVSGIMSMIKPIDDFVGMNHVIAIIFFVQSIGFLFKIFIYPHLVDRK